VLQCDAEALAPRPTAGKQRRRGRNSRKRIAGAKVVRYGAVQLYVLVVWLGVGVAAISNP
jgi:hypothetical protein